MKEATAFEVLERVVPELDEKEYVANMIEEDEPRSFAQLWDLIQDFLLDLELPADGNRDAKTLCEKIIKEIGYGEGGGDEEEEDEEGYSYCLLALSRRMGMVPADKRGLRWTQKNTLWPTHS